MVVARKYYDADGHVIDRGRDIYEFIESPLRDVPVGWHLPSLDRFHTPNNSFLAYPESSFQRADADRWLEFLEKADIEWSVLYPSNGLAFGLVIYPEWAVAYAKAYNNWLHERFLRVSPRLKGAALIPMQDVPSAVIELKRTVNELGFVAAVIPSNGLYTHLSDEKYWPIYEEAEKLDCALSIHGGSYGDLGFNTFTSFPAAKALGMPFPLAIALTGMMADGVLDRFPKLRIGFLEGGSAWVTLVLDRLTREMEYGGLELQKAPDEYFRDGRLFIGCEGNEKALSYVIERIGHESMVFGSDFPHEVTIDNCMEEINEILEREDLDKDHKLAILSDNTRRFYNS